MKVNIASLRECVRVCKISAVRSKGEAKAELDDIPSASQLHRDFLSSRCEMESQVEDGGEAVSTSMDINSITGLPEA